MIVTICVWDAQFSTGFWNSRLHRPLNSLARSLDSLHCLFSFTFCHLSLVISHSVHGSSLPQLSLSNSTMEFMAGARTRTHKHMSVIQKHDLASREFFFPGYLDRLQRYDAELLYAM